MLLPTETTKPKADLSVFNILIYGPPKIGKTTLASGFPNAIFLATEDGQNAIECFRVAITSWDTFIAACGELQAGNHSFKTVVVDTIDNLWTMCAQHVCRKRNVEHESELSYGLGAELVRSEFFRVINKLAMLPYGLVLISHSVVKETTAKGGSTTHRVIPSFKEREQPKLIGMADFVLFCDSYTALENGTASVRRVMRTKAADAYIAGDRTGLLPDPLPLDYEAFRVAFEKAVIEKAAAEAAKVKARAPATRTSPATTQPTQTPTQTPTAAPAATTNPKR